MSSSVFFRFRSQKEPSRVAFDGTGISVFELKREIISMSRLGDGTDFELEIRTEDTNEEYDDDTAIIPRSTTVIARRLPAAKPGRGGAARYVSGKMPQNAKNSHRQEAQTTKPSASVATNPSTTMNGAQTEEERIKAMFKMGADQWAQEQQTMANATPIHRGGPMKGKPQNMPDHPPPPGYICYRCGEKGHWIQACPTNNDPTFDGRPRVKRTTGIPRSFLKTVEKPTTMANDGTVDDTKQPSGIMVNAEGEWVVAEPDKAAWDKFQAKAKVSAAAQEAAAQGSKELQERGLECSIDKRLFVSPTKTPCCEKTFCHECITNALLDNDLRCPECSTDDVPIDDLSPDIEMIQKLRQYEEEEAAKNLLKADPQVKVKSESPEIPEPRKASKEPSPPKSPKSEGSKKRSAESDLKNDHKPPGPSELMAKQASAGGPTKSQQTNATGQNTTGQNTTGQNTTGQNTTSQQFPFSSANSMMQSMNAMTFPDMNGFMGMPQNMNGMGMNPALFNPMMMQDPSFMNNNWNMWGGGLPQQGGMGLGGVGFQNGMSAMMPNGGFGQQNMYNNNMGNSPMNTKGTNMNGMGLNGMGLNRQGAGQFANQQRSSFGIHSTNDDDSAYIRKPVNPHRHQGRRNLNRPADYREI